MSLWEPAQFTFVLAYRNALIPVKPGYQALSRTWLPGRVRNGPIGRQRKRTDHPTSICADDFSLRRVRRFIPTTFPNPLMCMARTNAELSEWARNSAVKLVSFNQRVPVRPPVSPLDLAVAI